jgi:hypothetical protein
MPGFADRFIAALRRLEGESDTGDIVSLFAPNAAISNPLVRYDSGGPDAAEHFWSTYRGTFREIASEFRHVVDVEGAAFLEWTSSGTTTQGQPFHYGGVSVLEHDGERIAAFRTYFDPAQVSADRAQHSGD